MGRYTPRLSAPEAPESPQKGSPSPNALWDSITSYVASRAFRALHPKLEIYRARVEVEGGGYLLVYDERITGSKAPRKEGR